ncbi:MAG: tetratricopeptide repeat protein [Balneolaceae bacterium]
MKNFLALFLLLFFLQGTLYAQNSRTSSDEIERAKKAYIEGIVHFENEEYEQALDYLTAAHLKLHDQAGVNFALADVYLATRDLVNAAYYGESAANLEPENKWYHLKLAEIYTRSGRNEAAVNAYTKALEYHPNDEDILYRLAESHIDFGELGKANEVYNQIINRVGGSFELHLRKFRNFNALQQQDSAMAELQEMRKINPGNLTTLRAISQYYLEIGEEEKALDVLLDARNRNSRDPQTLLLLAEIYVNQSEWDELGEIFVTMLQDPLIYPSQKLELVRFMYSQQQQNPQDRSLANQTSDVLLSFSENEPDYGPAQLLAAEFFLQRNELDHALKKLEKVNELMPDDPDAWRQRLQVLFSQQEYNQIIELSELANDNAPDDAYIQFFTGTSFMLENQSEKAAEWLENATMAPANRNFRSVIHGTLGDVMQDLDQWNDAESNYERALRLDSNNHNAMNNYAYYLSVRGEQLEYAEELARKAISFEPKNAAYLDTTGWIYFKLEKYDQALEYITRSVETGNASAEVYEHLGDVYNALDETNDAIKWWNKALELDSDREHLKERIQTAQK